MKTFILSALAIAVAAQDQPGNGSGGGIVSIPPQTGCPTVTATRELCTTCPVPACLGLATLTQKCGCPSAVPTVFLDFPCSKGCAGIGCSTSYDIIIPEIACPTSTGSSSSSSSGSSKPPEPTTTSSTTHGPGHSSTTSGRPPSSSTSSTTTRVPNNAVGAVAIPFFARWVGYVI